jgi:hypothetical protein
MPAQPVKHPEDNMRTFKFTVTLTGKGNNAEEAFHNAAENFQDTNRFFRHAEETELIPNISEVIAELQCTGQTTICAEILADLLEQEYCKTRCFSATLFANRENDVSIREIAPAKGTTPGLISINIANKRLEEHS